MKSIINAPGFLIAAAATLIFSVSLIQAHAEETIGQKAEDSGRSVVTGTKKAGRAVKDAVCAKGDVACAAQKVKHKAQNAGDDVGDKAHEVKNKVSN